MTSIVVDASILIDRFVGAPSHAAVIAARLAAADQLIAPAIVHGEIAAGLRRMALRGGIDEALGRTALMDACSLPILTLGFPPFAGRVWALRHHVSPYDAWYVAVAELTRVPLLTADARLARAAARTCVIELIRPGMS